MLDVAEHSLKWSSRQICIRQIENEHVQLILSFNLTILPENVVGSENNELYRPVVMIIKLDVISPSRKVIFLSDHTNVMTDTSHRERYSLET